MYFKKVILMLMLVFGGATFAQDFPMQDITAADWNFSGTKWKAVQDISLGNLSKDLLTNGEVLVSSGSSGTLKTKSEFGDLTLRFQFLQSEDALTSLIFQNQFEILLAGTSDKLPAGTIKKGDGSFQMPVQNATKAAGLWQKIEIQFVASVSGSEPAIIEKVVLNDVVIQENFFLNSSTGNAIGKTAIGLKAEKGVTAIKELKYLSQSATKPVSISNLRYTLRETGDWRSDYKPTDKPLIEKSNTELTAQVPNEFRDFLMTYTGDLNVQNNGLYAFALDYQGIANFKIDGKEVAGSSEIIYRNPQTGLIELTAGKHQFTYQYRKTWWRPAFGLFVSGADFKSYPLHPANALPATPMADGIFINVSGSEAKTIRSFMNFQGKKRMEIISVGTPEKLNYAFDLAIGTLLKVWKGQFADVTEMWHERGEPQLLEPLGMVSEFSGKPAFYMSNTKPMDSIDVFQDMKFKEYKMDEKGLPAFAYEFFGTKITQSIKPDGGTLEVNVKADGSGIKHILASGEKVVDLGTNKYKIGDKYIQWKSGPKTEILKYNGQEYLVALCGNTLVYSINW